MLLTMSMMMALYRFVFDVRDETSEPTNFLRIPASLSRSGTSLAGFAGTLKGSKRLKGVLWKFDELSMI
jgi:hypothetical protein